MEANQVNALIASLQSQRNAAMNGLATAQSELSVAKDVIAELQKLLVEARSNKEPA